VRQPARSSARTSRPVRGSVLTAYKDSRYVAYLANDAALALRAFDQLDQALMLYGTALRYSFRKYEFNIPVTLLNASVALEEQNRLARSDACVDLSLAFAELNHDWGQKFAALLHRFHHLAFARPVRGGRGDVANPRPGGSVIRPAQGRGRAQLRKFMFPSREAHGGTAR
jgi:hypothetical protein